MPTRYVVSLNDAQSELERAERFDLHTYFNQRSDVEIIGIGYGGFSATFDTDDIEVVKEIRHDLADVAFVDEDAQAGSDADPALEFDVHADNMKSLMLRMDRGPLNDAEKEEFYRSLSNLTGVPVSELKENSTFIDTPDSRKTKKPSGP